MKQPIAEVLFSMGRSHLMVAGFCLATQGDKCRDSDCWTTEMIRWVADAINEWNTTVERQQIASD